MSYPLCLNARNINKMTLVVASATSDFGFLIADTLLSVPFYLKGHEGPVNGKFHALKIQILNSDTAIAFAGDVETSFKLIGNLYAELSADPGIDVCQRLLESYKRVIERMLDQTPPDCEFLVLQLTPDGRKLAHVTKKEISYRSRAYIGDSEAYQRMMSLRRARRPPTMQHVQGPDGTFRTVPLVTSEGEIEFEEVSNAMEELVHGRQSESVGAIGGCVIRVVDARISGALEYLQSAEVSVSPAEGQSGFSALASNSSVRGIGIYYRSGKMGFLFIVGDAEPCRKEYAETLSQFLRAAKVKYGLDLVGGAWSDLS